MHDDEDNATRYSDPLDQGAANEEQIREMRERAIRATTAPEKHPDFDGLHCVGASDRNSDCCGEALPKERLAAGRVRCVDCQRIKEVRLKAYHR